MTQFHMFELLIYTGSQQSTRKFAPQMTMIKTVYSAATTKL